ATKGSSDNRVLTGV
nr:RecName: Full=Unknown protein from spot 112 of 2D-PAGE of thylakoid [Pisum sativum]